MASSKHHVPADDAPAEEWIERLRGLGYSPTSAVKPVGNYYDLHGFWVPPTVGPGPELPNLAAPRKRKLVGGVDPAWFEIDRLVALQLHHRDVYDALRSRLDDVDAQAALPQDDAARVRAQRDKLALAVEAGMLNQDAATQQLAEWADEQGISLADL